MAVHGPAPTNKLSMLPSATAKFKSELKQHVKCLTLTGSFKKKSALHSESLNTDSSSTNYLKACRFIQIQYIIETGIPIYMLIKANDTSQ